MKTSEFSAPMPEDIARVLSETVTTPIQTRGPLPRGGYLLVSGEVVDLEELVDELRSEVAGFPLTFVVHDWGMLQVDRFFGKLEPLFHPNDGLWLIQSPQRRGEGKAMSGVVLDIESNKSDERLYKMLVGDLVFFAGQRTDPQRIFEWRHRARATIVHGEGPNRILTIRKAQQLRLRTYEMIGDTLKGV